MKAFLARLFCRSSQPKTLHAQIAKVMAEHYPFPADEIYKAFKILGSWDQVECLCEFTVVSGFSAPYHTIGVFLDRTDGKAFAASWVKMKQKNRLGSFVRSDGGLQ